MSRARGAPAPIAFYSRRGCHLCDEARGELQRIGVSYVEIDIEQDDEVLARYFERIPVIEAGGRVIAEGNLHGVRLDRLLGRFR